MLSPLSLSSSPSPSKFPSLSLVLFRSPDRFSSLVWARQFEFIPETNGGKGYGQWNEIMDEQPKNPTGRESDPSSALEWIAVKRLKALCRIKEPTVNDGIEMVGAANLLKRTRSSCRETQRAKEQAEKAAMMLSQAEHLRIRGVELLSESQKSIEKLL